MLTVGRKEGSEEQVEIKLEGLEEINIDTSTSRAVITLIYASGTAVRLNMAKDDAIILTEALKQGFANDHHSIQEYETYKAQMKEYGCGRMIVPYDVWKAYREYDERTKKMQEATRG